MLGAPIGMTIGMILKSQAENQESGNLDVVENKKEPVSALVIIILKALAGGTFTFLACCHFLLQEFFQKNGENKCGKFLSFVLGFGIIVLINVTMPEHEH